MKENERKWKKMKENERKLRKICFLSFSLGGWSNRAERWVDARF